jgi:hypothetical protein
MQTKTFDSLPAQTNGEERKGFWKSSDGTQNMHARFHFLYALARFLLFVSGAN